jgi:hypothetical protein
MGIAFAPNSNYVWCAQQFGSSSANLLMSGRDKSGRGFRILRAPFQQSSSWGDWVAVEARDGPLVGWLLWDAANQRAAKVHPLPEVFGSLAIHPKQPHVFWSDSKAIRSWDAAADKAGIEIPTTQVAHDLRFSADGSLLAADTGPRLVVFDAQSGESKYELPRFGMTSQPETTARPFWDLTAKNRVCMGVAAAGQPTRNLWFGFPRTRSGSKCSRPRILGRRLIPG